MSSNVLNAVQFLKDESVASAPLAKKVAFLESKGLSQEEIESALAQSKTNENTLKAVENQQNSFLAYPERPFQQQMQQPYGWKEFALTSMSIIGVSYLAYDIIQVK